MITKYAWYQLLMLFEFKIAILFIFGAEKSASSTSVKIIILIIIGAKWLKVLMAFVSKLNIEFAMPFF